MTLRVSTRQDRRAAAAMARRGEWGPWERRAFCGAAELRGTVMEHMRCAWVNGVYSVQRYDCRSDWGTVTQLSIRRHDEQPARSWPDLQRIKNELCGPSAVAVEVFPAQSDVVDQAPMTHLWVLPSNVALPFGLHLPSAWAKPVRP